MLLKWKIYTSITNNNKIISFSFTFFRPLMTILMSMSMSSIWYSIYKLIPNKHFFFWGYKLEVKESERKRWKEQVQHLRQSLFIWKVRKLMIIIIRFKLLKWAKNFIRKFEFWTISISNHSHSLLSWTLYIQYV